MQYAFRGTSGLVINATDKPVLSGLTDMSYMFYQSAGLTGNFSGWDTSKVTTMSNMFNGATGFDQDLSSRIVSGVKTTSYFANILNGTNLSTYNYNAILDSWSKQGVVDGATSVNFASAKYGGCVENAQVGIEGHANLVQPVADGGKAWAITDGGLEICKSISTYPECNTPDITVGDYTISACNVGATTAGTGYDETTAGRKFQRGNDYGFSDTAEISTGETEVNASAY
jgi:surface protein